jgi:hypothetical protein
MVDDGDDMVKKIQEAFGIKSKANSNYTNTITHENQNNVLDYIPPQPDATYKPGFSDGYRHDFANSAAYRKVVERMMTTENYDQFTDEEYNSLNEDEWKGINKFGEFKKEEEAKKKR